MHCSPPMAPISRFRCLQSRKIQMYSVQQSDRLCHRRKRKSIEVQQEDFFCEPHPCRAHLGILRKSGGGTGWGRKCGSEGRQLSVPVNFKQATMRCKSEQVNAIKKQSPALIYSINPPKIKYWLTPLTIVLFIQNIVFFHVFIFIVS